MTTTNTTFEFDTLKPQHYYKEINSSTIMHIERISSSIAVLKFTDELNNDIDIPTGIVVFEFDYQNVSKKIVTKPLKYTQRYCLCSTENYVIEYNKSVLVNLHSRRVWNIVSPV